MWSQQGGRAMSGRAGGRAGSERAGRRKGSEWQGRRSGDGGWVAGAQKVGGGRGVGGCADSEWKAGGRTGSDRQGGGASGLRESREDRQRLLSWYK